MSLPGGVDFTMDTAFGELPTPLVAASIANAGTNADPNQQMNPGAQTGMLAFSL